MWLARRVGPQSLGFVLSASCEGKVAIARDMEINGPHRASTDVNDVQDCFQAKAPALSQYVFTAVSRLTLASSL